ncbi:tyrosinase family oxidase copper chaperone [Actinoplanes sp. NEAU-A12]|uniref:Tyrosinase family oxidase copper chaperone n=1 Tax=Actinoplanes sandaracinus TaxID=3045177 RepID=A0ABT6WVT3_9ACTN|nr:tyrosinase family oxidase copper chaperone [Actinoplanes sandaracinus]MDI6103846.1 tyrosinase family oxidase copper chaperone [Actinoplanes sandaracinus]
MSTVSRRDALRYGAAAAAVVAGVAGAQVLATPAAARDPRDFEMEYRGKKIKGTHPVTGVAALSARGQRPNRSHEVYINGRKLSVMEIELPAAGGGVTIGYISAINHYEPVLIDADRNSNGLLKLTKRAVDVLGDTELTALAGAGHDHVR